VGFINMPEIGRKITSATGAAGLRGEIPGVCRPRDFSQDHATHRGKILAGFELSGHDMPTTIRGA